MLLLKVTFLVANSTPIVGVVPIGNLDWVNYDIRHVFPTLEFPIIITLKEATSKSLGLSWSISRDEIIFLIYKFYFCEKIKNF